MGDYMNKGHGWTLVTKTQTINQGETILYGAIIHASADGGYVSLYEGLDAGSGRLIGTYHTLAVLNLTLDLLGIRLDRGLHVVIGDDVTSCLLIWDPFVDEGPERTS